MKFHYKTGEMFVERATGDFYVLRQGLEDKWVLGQVSSHSGYCTSSYCCDEKEMMKILMAGYIRLRRRD